MNLANSLSEESKQKEIMGGHRQAEGDDNKMEEG